MESHHSSLFSFDYQYIQSMFHVILLILAKILDTLYSSFIFEVESESNNNSPSSLTNNGISNSSSDSEADVSDTDNSSKPHVSFQNIPPTENTHQQDPTCKHHPLRRMSNLFFFNNDSIDSRLDELIDEDVLWRKRAISAPSDISPSHSSPERRITTQKENNNIKEENSSTESNNNQFSTITTTTNEDLTYSEPILTTNDEAQLALHILEEHSSSNSKRRGFLTKSSSTNTSVTSSSNSTSPNSPPPLGKVGKGNSFVELRKKLTEFEFPKKKSED